MTKEEAKELLPIITAFAEGNSIEVKGSYGEWVEVTSPDFGNGPKNYRIKSTPKYRPFKNVEECLKEMENHSHFGWIKLKNEESVYKHFEEINNDGVGSDSIIIIFEEALNHCIFVDGSPFGIKEE